MINKNINSINLLENFLDERNYEYQSYNDIIEIYDNGISENKIGVLYFKCSEKENKMEVYFLNEEQILLNLQKDSWENLKNSTDKKIFLVNDNDINSIFILYI